MDGLKKRMFKDHIWSRVTVNQPIQFESFEHLAEVKSQTRDLGSPEWELSIVKLDVRHLGLGLELALVVDKQGVALVC